MESLYTIALPTDKEYIGMFEDILRMVTIQVTIQFLYALNTSAEFMTVDFLLLIIYVILGVCLYWLVVRKVFHITTKPQ